MTALDENPQVYAISGDWHGDAVFARAAVRYAGEHGAKTLIHLGDFGYNFTHSFLRSLTWTLDRFDMDLYFIDGNHENFDKLYSYPQDENGLRVITDRIKHIPRGRTWTWGSKTYMGFGGAASVDRLSRVEGHSWWPQERITAGDMYRALDTQEQVDVMFTHDAPTNAWCRRDPENDTSWIPDVAFHESEVSGNMIQSLVDHFKPKVLYHGHFHRLYEDEVGIPGTTVIGLDCNGDATNRFALSRNTAIRITT